MRGTIILSLLLFLSLNTLAYTDESINVICFELPPYCYLENNEIKGVVVDIYNEMRKNITFNLPDIILRPLSRAFFEINNGNTILLLLTRTASRENNYQWIDKVYSDALVFINTSKELPINTFDAARASGVVLTRQNAVTEETLVNNGIVNIDSSSLDEEQQFKKLQYNRAKIWFVPLSVAKNILKKNNSMDQYNIGKSVSDLDLYIVGSKEIPIDIIDELRTALNIVNKQRIFSKYGLE